MIIIDPSWPIREFLKPTLPAPGPAITFFQPATPLSEPDCESPPRGRAEINILQPSKAGLDPKKNGAKRRKFFKNEVKKRRGFFEFSPQSFGLKYPTQLDLGFLPVFFWMPARSSQHPAGPPSWTSTSFGGGGATSTPFQPVFFFPSSQLHP